MSVWIFIWETMKEVPLNHLNKRVRVGDIGHLDFWLCNTCEELRGDGTREVL